MMEPVEFKERPAKVLPEKTWAANGLNGRKEHNVINSLYLESELLEQHNIHLQKKFKAMKENEVRYELYNCDDECDLIFVAYGTTSRICKSVIGLAAKEGIKLGMVRPITVWPFPTEAFEKTIGKTKNGYLAVEMSCGQMVDDVRAAVLGRKPVEFYGRSGGMIPEPQDILDKVKELVGGAK